MRQKIPGPRDRGENWHGSRSRKHVGKKEGNMVEGGTCDGKSWEHCGRRRQHVARSREHGVGAGNMVHGSGNMVHGSGSMVHGSGNTMQDAENILRNELGT